MTYYTGTPETTMPIEGNDRAILRDLAKRIAEIAAEPIMAERIALWKRHNALDRPRAMILVFPEGSWRELLTDKDLVCESPEARGVEMGFRQQIYQYEHFDSDNVITNELFVSKVVHNTGWGISAQWEHSSDPTGANTFKPVIHEPSDLKKFQMPQVSVDEEQSAGRLQANLDLFGDILDVQLVGIKHLSTHLMNIYTSLRGLAEVMMDMVMNPGMLHEAMSLLEEGTRGMHQQYLDLGLLSLNNDNSYCGTGGCSWTDELPAGDFDGTVRFKDMWTSAEAQELAQVSPEMHEEFSLQYERRLMEPFGLSCYGCCEDLERKLDDVLRVSNIRRISISPWSDVAACAEKIGRKACLNWKPLPVHLCGRFDEDALRAYLRHNLTVSKDCCIDAVLKDTHTCDNHPERFDRWTQIAREAVEEIG